jgi:sulfur-carrier protein
MIEVHLDAWLREFGAPTDTRLSAANVEELLVALESRYPRLRFRLRDETGELRRFIRIFFDGEDVSESQGIRASLKGARTVDILHSIAGG